MPLARSLWTDPGVMRYMGGPMSEEELHARLALEIGRQERFGVQYWPIFFCETGEFAGCSGLRPWHDEPGVFELGIHVMQPLWSKRLGEEASRAVMRYAFDELGVTALTAGHGPGNVHSKAMIERLGFRYTHLEPWGPKAVLHPFYRIERAGYMEPAFQT